ncbi:MAG: flagellar motor switch protein FliG [Calditrichaeota bacterium]|nr:MAG: flagellar motor switch protein FliG [Calditrichota bacterium]
MEYEKLTGTQKSAILMVSLGVDTASVLFKNMPEKEMEQVAMSIASLDEVPSELMDRVVDEFFQMIKAQEFITQGGVDYASRLLEEAIGSNKANEIIRRMEAVQSEAARGFSLLKRADIQQVQNLIANEHPQTISLVLAHLEPKQATAVLAGLPVELQSDVIYRLANMEKISSDLLDDVENIIKVQIESVYTRELNEVGGTKSVAEILNLSGKITEKQIIEHIQELNADLAQEIRGLMFTFEDIQKIDDRGIQRLLKEVDTKVLTIALKGSSELIQEKILGNMSTRAGEMVKEEMEFLGPLRVKEVDDSQRQIVEVIRNLEEEGEIVIVGGDGGDEFIV